MACARHKSLGSLTAKSVGLIFCLIASTAVMSQSLPDDHDQAWQIVSQQPTKSGLSEFLNKFPSTFYLNEILELYETAGDGPVPQTPATVTSTETVASTDAEEAEGSVEQNPEINAAVFTETPENILEFRDGLIFRTDTQEELGLLEVLNLAPQFGPPVDGLPDSVWQNGTCANCHSWDQAKLCDHGTLLGGFSPDALRRIQHPFGGAFKEFMVSWAKTGC
ncbi:MAG: hypothetical protein AAF429_01230 [Pseudomonadota bacterium]